MQPTRRLRRTLWTLAGVYWCIIFTLTHVPAQRIPGIAINDKIAHLLAYGGLGGLLFLSLWASYPHWQQIGIVVLAIGMSYGAIDEWLQAIPILHRDCSLLDWFADATGLAIAAMVLTYFRYRWRSAGARPSP